MRVVSAILLPVVLLGCTWAYIQFAAAIRVQPIQLTPNMDESSWRVTIDRTFDCIPDPESGFAALTVRLKQQTVLNILAKIPATAKVELDRLTGVEQGVNELFVSANMAALGDFAFDSDQPRAMRVQIFRGDRLVEEKTFWSKSGATFLHETVLFRAFGEPSASDDDHK